jgi:L-rhamnose mutarotase
MIRRAFTMRLKDGAIGEYKRQHDQVWPEMVAEIERSGIASMTIFNRGETLFLMSEITDEGAWDRLWNSEVSKRWSALMGPLMYQTPEGKVDAAELTEVFHLSTAAGHDSHRAGQTE